MSRAPGVRFNLPFLHGLYLSFNAVPDAYFLGDGPSCVFAKAEHLHGRHDLFSNILSCGGDHRVQYTGVNIFNIAGNFEALIARALKRIADWPACSVLFTGAMPMCAIAGSDYERIMREALAGCGKPAYLIPRRSSMSGDWLDGYAGMMEVLAAGLDLAGARPERGAAALVGHLMDRSEGDQAANVAELERMTRAAGWEPVSVWLSGRPYAHLSAARRASAVISLPYARKAAGILAGRLGVPLIEAGLPLGLEASRRFVETLSRAAGRAARARRFAEAELAEAAGRLRWTVPHAFEARRFAFAGDPHMTARLAELVAEFGGETVFSVVMGGPHHSPPGERAAHEAPPGPGYEPDRARLRAAFEERGGASADLLVTNSLGARYIRPRAPWLELGFPSEHEHRLEDEPYLGFRGAVALASRMANETVKGMCRREWAA